MQAGEDEGIGCNPKTAARRKYEPVADELMRRYAARMSVRTIGDWLNSQGIKSEPGELWRWLKRRQARQEKQKKIQSMLMAGASEVAGQSAPQAAPQAVQAATPTPSTTMKPNPSPSVFRSSRAPDPSDRPGTSAHEKELDARIEKALQESRAKRSPFALKSKAAEK